MAERTVDRALEQTGTGASLDRRRAKRLHNRHIAELDAAIVDTQSRSIRSCVRWMNWISVSAWP